MSTSENQCFGTRSFILKVGYRYAISMELHIIPNDMNDTTWFDHGFTTDGIIQKLNTILYNKVICRKDDIESFNLVEDEDLLIAYKFKKNVTKDLIVLSKGQLSSHGTKVVEIPSRRNTRFGKYQTVIYYPEKIMVTVALKEQARTLLDISLNREDTLDSAYFTKLKEITNSEKRKKEAIRKIINPADCDNEEKNSKHSRKIDLKGTNPGKNMQTVLDNFLLKDSEDCNLNEETEHYDTEEISSKCKEKSKSIGTNSIKNMQTMLDQFVRKEESKVLLSYDNFSQSDEQGTLPNIQNNQFGEKVNRNQDEENIKVTDDKFEKNLGSMKSSYRKSELPNKRIDKSNHMINLGKENNSPGESIDNASKYYNKAIETKFISNSDSEDFENINLKSVKRKANSISSANTKKRKFTKQKNTYKNEKDESQKLSSSKCSNTDTTSIQKQLSVQNLVEPNKDTIKQFDKIGDISCFLDESTKNDGDGEDMTKEDIAQSLRPLQDLSCTQLIKKVKSLESFLLKILKGEIECERHDTFKKGGKEKIILGVSKAMGILSEEQEDALSQTLLKMFCSKSSKYFDYVMKVLLPETMVAIYSQFNNISQEEGNKIITENFC